MKKEFFVGWNDETPKSYSRTGKRFFFVVLLAMLAIGAIYSISERGFIDSYFEYGTLTEKTGFIVKEPVWGLRTLENGQVKTIPLVGFGKFGPDQALEGIINKISEFEGKEVTIRGTLFYYKERIWMELTEGAQSLINYQEMEDPVRKVSILGDKTLSGEIVDPKCFFGVMNPADKAVHRSCAVRCISGGGPPVLAIREGGEFVDYYFLVEEEGNPLNQEILAFVGIPVKLSGNVREMDDWKILEMSDDINSQIELSAFLSYIPECN